MPLGLVGKIPAVTLCGEAEVHAGGSTTPENAPPQAKSARRRRSPAPVQIPSARKGRSTSPAPTSGAPFGWWSSPPPKPARSTSATWSSAPTITIDPHTAAVTVTSDPLPQIVDGVPLQAARRSTSNVTRPGFMLNPTNCSAAAGLGDARRRCRARAHRSPRRSGSRAARACRSSPRSRRPRRRTRAKPTGRAST